MTDAIEADEEAQFTGKELSVGDDGFVTGQQTAEIPCYYGYTVTATVVSYEFGPDKDKKINHVPNIVISDEDGGIVENPYAHDSGDADQAISNAMGVARDVIDDPERYIDC